MYSESINNNVFSVVKEIISIFSLVRYFLTWSKKRKVFDLETKSLLILVIYIHIFWQHVYGCFVEI